MDNSFPNTTAFLRHGSAAPVSVKDAFAGKQYVLVYFSAHWCGPCRNFTPKLAALYTSLQAKRQDFEIVFVSSDENETAFDEYRAEMPWLALPFTDRDRKELLSRKFNVEGIPTLVVLNADGTVLNDDAAGKVRADPQGDRFPWKPRSFWEIMGTAPIQTKSGKPFTPDKLKSMTFGIYFSAHWCPPCRGFTPVLCEVYKKMKALPKSDNNEIIFASRDETEEDYKNYWGEMPWPAFPFGDERTSELMDLLKVQGIPTLITFDSQGNVLNSKARGAASKDATGENFPWIPPPPPLLIPFRQDEDTIDAVQESRCIILNLLNATAAESAGVSATFDEAAKAYDAAHKASGTPNAVRFLKTETSDTAQGKMRVPEDCMEGHKLTAMEGNYRCDCCGQDAAPSMSCRQCDFDVCMTCFEAKKSPPNPVLRLWSQLAQASDESLAAPRTGPFVCSIKLRSEGKIMEGAVTSTSLAAFIGN